MDKLMDMYLLMDKYMLKYMLKYMYSLICLGLLGFACLCLNVASKSSICLICLTLLDLADGWRRQALWQQLLPQVQEQVQVQAQVQVTGTGTAGFAEKQTANPAFAAFAAPCPNRGFAPGGR